MPPKQENFNQVCTSSYFDVTLRYDSTVHADILVHKFAGTVLPEKTDSTYQWTYTHNEARQWNTVSNSTVFTGGRPQHK